MFTFVRRSAALVAAAALSFGCADNAPTPSGPDGPAAKPPSMNFTNGPSNPGPFVVRVEGQLVFFINTDLESDRLSLHLRTDDIVLCGGSQGIADPADAQFITTASATEQFLVQIRNSDSSVSVYGTSDLAEAGIAPFDLPVFCAFINGPNKIASGSVKHVQNLSNTSFAVRWGGKLDGTDGRQYSYNEHLQFLVLPSGESRTTVSDINLKAQ